MIGMCVGVSSGRRIKEQSEHYLNLPFNFSFFYTSPSPVYTLLQGDRQRRLYQEPVSGAVPPDNLLLCTFFLGEGGLRLLVRG